MKKKLILVLCILFLTTGCVSINDSSIEGIIKEVTSSNSKIYNHSNEGFKYYLPSGMTISYKDEYNEIIKCDGYKFYLYVDLVKYFNDVGNEYEVEKNIYYSHIFESKKIKGIVNVYEIESDKYLVSVNYNYAKIEAYVKKKDINKAVTKALIIATTMKYNKNVVNNMFGKDLSSLEEEVNVFNIEDDSSTFLQVDDTYYEEENYDSEVIR